MPIRRWLWLVCLVGWIAGCRGDDVGAAQGGFDVSPTSLDFGRVLEGTPVTRTVELVATGRRDVSVTVDVPPPFTTLATTATIPGSGALTLEVTYTPVEGRQEETLTLRSGDEIRTVSLRAEGVRSLECVPSGPCRETTFDIETGTCTERVAPDNTACAPNDLCLANGLCSSGVCLGSARNCDDGNVCTQDACSSETGCVNVPKACPAPSNPCHVAVCDPEEGCGVAQAPDFTLCGPADCVTANLCQSGTCVEMPTPDGFICHPPTPCQGEGTCQNQQCKRPDPVPLLPAFTLDLPATARLDAEGRTRVIEGPGGIFLELCGLAPPADAGLAGVTEDGGVDWRCGLASYTANGFERFVEPYPDSAPRVLFAVSDKDVFVQKAAALESYDITMGARKWVADFSQLAVPPEVASGSTVEFAPRRAAVMSTGDVLASVRWAQPPPQGGGYRPFGYHTLVRVNSDGGVRVLASPLQGNGGGTALTAGDDQVVMTGADGLHEHYVFKPDGGFLAGYKLGGDSGMEELSLAGQTMVVGQRLLGVLPGDPLQLPRFVGSLPLDAGERPDWPGVLLQARQGYSLVRACPDPLTSCEPFDEAIAVRAFPLGVDGGWPQAGSLTYRVDVAPTYAGATLAGTTLVNGGGIVTLTQTTDGGVRTQLQGFDRGTSVFACQMPPDKKIRGSAFSQGNAFVVAEKADGGQAFEAYELRGVNLEQKGWPVPEGVSGTRRAR